MSINLLSSILYGINCSNHFSAKFIISANYSIALTDKNIDKSLVLYWKLSGIELEPGSKIFTARCKNLYILTTKHKVMAENKIDRIKIENPFDQVIKVIDNTDYSYKEMDIEEDLQIVKERLNTPRILNRTTSSKASTSKRKYDFPEISNTEEETINYYFIAGIIDNKKYKILINCHDPKSSREWHPHLSYYVSEPTNLKLQHIEQKYKAEDLKLIIPKSGSHHHKNIYPQVTNLEVSKKLK